MYKVLMLLLALPKTIIFNFKYLPFNDAIKLPVIISNKCYLKCTNGSVKINAADIKFGMIRIGFGSVGIFDEKKSRSIWEVSGKVIFSGHCRIGHGSKISVQKNGKLVLGNNFTITAESTIVCYEYIEFGENCLLSWDILIMDSDFHCIKDFSGKIVNSNERIFIGSKVWIGARSTILKGVSIPHDVIVGSNSLVTKKKYSPHTVIAGIPATTVSENVKWSQ